MGKHTMRFIAVLAVIAVSFVNAGAAQGTTVDVQPGVIEPGSPLYGVDVAFDDALVSLGVKTAADVVYERASEAAVAFEANNTAAATQALDEMNRVAQTATGVNATRLDQATAVLESVQSVVPAEAEQGLNTALVEIDQAGNRLPTDGPGSGVSDRLDGVRP